MLIRVNGRSELTIPRIGVALSGGGLRGLAHIGVLAELERAGIPIHFIAGTSAGAVVAALHATGHGSQEMTELAHELNLHDLIDAKFSLNQLVKYGMKWLFTGKFRLLSVIPAGMIKGERVEQYFRSLWGNRTVKETKLPLAITAVDLNTAETVFFTTLLRQKPDILHAKYDHSISLIEAVRASISIPGIFQPKVYQGMTLVDGAVKNNLPADILRSMGAEVVLGVDLGYDGQPNFGIQSVGEVLLQCIEIMSREVTLLKGRQLSDLVIRPQTFDLTFRSVKDIDRCIERGRAATKSDLPDIITLLNDKIKQKL
ncbi:MAG: patatin-like phospholipase family protein [Sporomusaceae bacterium]|nr:patatin-like phospholipase family protein [Sporomusaceae bacterium]